MEWTSYSNDSACVKDCIQICLLIGILSHLLGTAMRGGVDDIIRELCEVEARAAQLIAKRMTLASMEVC